MQHYSTAPGRGYQEGDAWMWCAVADFAEWNVLNKRH